LGEATVYLRNDQGLELAGSATAARAFGRASGSQAGSRALVREADLHPLERMRIAGQRLDWTPDLGAQIGSLHWWRGLVTCTALCAATWTLAPGFRPVLGDVPRALAGAESDEARAQAIAPLGLGGNTGRRMAANDLVVPLAEAPERPTLDLAATLGAGDDFGRMLERAGVGGVDAQQASALVRQAVSLGDIAPGTRIEMTLGRRASKMVSRPLDHLAFRARFDLALSLTRAASGLVMTRQPIAISNTPLRIQGLVGSSLYRSARAAGAPAKVVDAYIKAMATRLSIGGDIGAADSFDMVIEQAKAATGETRTGALLFAGIDQGARRTQLVRWTMPGAGGGAEGWYDANGQFEQRGQMGMPVAGHITSNFGWRMHPLLGFLKMHKGLDIGAAYGSPIHAVIDGTVSFTGRAGGYGNFVKLNHAAGLVSGYGHMSRIAVSPGQHVARGQVIGFVGSTGMSTGPHLHWEIWKNGVSINPRSISFDSVSQLSGDDMRAFRARVASLLAVKPGGG
jgi:murein DD-endopeptidase MepM/ murein hydrolase activator NlpD